MEYLRISSIDYYHSSVTSSSLAFYVFVCFRKYCFCRRHFAADPFNREAGERLWKELLIHGGARDPHEMLQALLGDTDTRGDAGVRAGVVSLLKDMGVS